MIFLFFRCSLVFSVISLTLTLTLIFYPSIHFYLSPSLYSSLSISFSIYLSVCLCLCLSVSLSLSLSLHPHIIHSPVQSVSRCDFAASPRQCVFTHTAAALTVDDVSFAAFGTTAYFGTWALIVSFVVSMRLIALSLVISVWMIVLSFVVSRQIVTLDGKMNR